MRITPEQMQRLGTAAERRFEQQLTERLRAGFGALIVDLCLDDAAVAHTVRQVIDLARRHGITHEADVATFLDAVMTLQSGLDDDPRYPWATEILARSDLSGTQKVSLLHDHIVFALR